MQMVGTGGNNFSKHTKRTEKCTKKSGKRRDACIRCGFRGMVIKKRFPNDRPLDLKMAAGGQIGNRLDDLRVMSASDYNTAL